jgi:C_GCAxxG_C_C family probable redox protein
MSRGDKAKELFCQGYNCSQSVAMAFADLLDMDEKTVAKLVCGFGGGMGRMREVCGCMSAIVFVMSSLYGYDDNNDSQGKKQIYTQIQSLGEQFKQDNGSIICKELLGLNNNGFDNPSPAPRTHSYYKKRPCPELAKYSADILEKYIENRK